jgi:hypothetical protein
VCLIVAVVAALAQSGQIIVSAVFGLVVKVSNRQNDLYWPSLPNGFTELIFVFGIDPIVRELFSRVECTVRYSPAFRPVG